MSGHLNLVTEADIRRFWAAVTKTSTCWLWTGERNNNGYGRLSLWRDAGRKRIFAHRLSYWIATGDLPSLLRHSCDNPACVNPEHLLPGTQAQNVLDAVERGRADHSGLFAHIQHRYTQVARRIEIGAKKCSRCRIEKRFSEFGMDRSSLDGRCNYCLSCAREIQAGRRRQRRVGHGDAA